MNSAIKLSTEEKSQIVPKIKMYLNDELDTRMEEVKESIYVLEKPTP